MVLLGSFAGGALINEEMGAELVLKGRSFRIRRPPLFELPSIHSRLSRTQRWHGGVPGLPIVSLFKGMDVSRERGAFTRRWGSVDVGDGDLQIASALALSTVQTRPRHAFHGARGAGHEWFHVDC